MQDSIVLLEEGNRPYQCYPKWDMFLKWSFKGWHPTTALCRWGEECKRQHLVAEEAVAGSAVSLTAYGLPLAVTPSFKYLGRVLLASDDALLEVIRKLRRARHKWACLLRVLSWEVVNVLV